MIADGKKVFVAMSGGVDSSVAAFLLKKATPNNFKKLFGRPTPKGFRGYDVAGVFMRCYNLDGCAEKDAEDARRVAEKLHIPFYVFDFEDEYKKKVVDYMVNGYKKGITPNPDVMCNREIKFGLFLEKALSLGADYIATGHYVRLKEIPTLTVGTPTPKGVGVGADYVATGRYLKIESRIQNIESIKKNSGDLNSKFYILHSSRDQNKDQSYFLWTLTQGQLKNCLFPIGGYLKSEVREIARKADLPTAEKKDSQGICFLGKVTLEDFLGNYLKPKVGAVLSQAGEILGEHKGAHFYTIGQRHIDMVNRKGQIANSRPIYVAEKNIKKNVVVVAEGSENPVLYKHEINITNVNFINQQLTTNNPQQVFARVRYRQLLAPAKLICSRGSLVVSCKLKFDSPVKFVAPGQSAVFYNSSDEVLGGGVIS